MSNVVPPGYESFHEARNRAFDLWSSDAWTKLLGLLVTGKLESWRADVAGAVAPVPKDYWEGRKGRHLCLARRIDEMRGTPVFRKEDLQRELPSRLERREMLDAKNRVRRAQEEETKSASVQDSAAASQPESEGGRPGRRNAPESDLFWIEAARIVHVGDGNNGPTAFADTMEKWSKSKMKRPYSRETIEDKLRLLRVALRLK